MVKGRCCNPYGYSGHNFYQTLRNITERVIAKAKNLDLKEIDKNADGICESCHSAINLGRKRKADDDMGESSTAKQPKAGSSTSQNPVDVASDSENTDTDQPEEFNPDDFDDDDRNGIKEALNALLYELKLPQIKDDKLRYANYQTNLLTKMVQRLCSLLFTKTDDDLVNDKIVRQLKEKMDETTSRDMKIKILSVLPKDWSAQKIQTIFGDSVTIYMINQAKNLLKKMEFYVEHQRKSAQKRSQRQPSTK